jgi:hypothetical protein
MHEQSHHRSTAYKDYSNGVFVTSTRVPSDAKKCVVCEHHHGPWAFPLGGGVTTCMSCRLSQGRIAPGSRELDRLARLINCGYLPTPSYWIKDRRWTGGCLHSYHSSKVLHINRSQVENTPPSISSRIEMNVLLQVTQVLDGLARGERVIPDKDDVPIANLKPIKVMFTNHELPELPEYIALAEVRRRVETVNERSVTGVLGRVLKSPPLAR